MLLCCIILLLLLLTKIRIKIKIRFYDGRESLDVLGLGSHLGCSQFYLSVLFVRFQFVFVCSFTRRFFAVNI